MEQSLQTVNQNNRLMEWLKCVEACRNSGLTVAQWCQENGIPTSTYYARQRKVFQAAAARQEPCFVKVPVGEAAAASNAAATIRLEGLSIDVYSGTDADTLRAILQAAKHAE